MIPGPDTGQQVGWYLLSGGRGHILWVLGALLSCLVAEMEDCLKLLLESPLVLLRERLIPPSLRGLPMVKIVYDLK
jgi:hypothetical protein